MQHANNMTFYWDHNITKLITKKDRSFQKTACYIELIEMHRLKNLNFNLGDECGLGELLYSSPMHGEPVYVLLVPDPGLGLPTREPAPRKLNGGVICKGA